MSPAPPSSFARCGPSAAGRTFPGATDTPTGGRRCRGASARSCPGHDQPHTRQSLDGQRPGEQSQPRPVRPRQARMSTRPLALGHSELMAQHQDLGVLPPRLPARQAQQGHGPGNNQEDQLQAHKPKIIARPARPGRGSHAPDTGPSHRRPEDASAQVAKVFGIHSTEVGTQKRHGRAVRRAERGCRRRRWWCRTRCRRRARWRTAWPSWPSAP